MINYSFVPYVIIKMKQDCLKLYSVIIHTSDHVERKVLKYENY